jgi:hypothetical protein
MSDSFLARWSLRKQEARQVEREPETLAPQEGEAAAEPEGAALPVEEPEITPEEIAQLPDIGELTAGSDLTGFLRKGVPEALRNAALRRMWSLDPAIRDFVGEARDYSYDWNTPGGVPGSGELPPGEDVEAMLRQVFGDSEPPAPAADQSGVEASRVRDRAAAPVAQTDGPPALQQSSAAEGYQTGPAEADDQKKGKADNIFATADRPKNPAAPQQGHVAAAPGDAAARRHGGAKPV